MTLEETKIFQTVAALDHIGPVSICNTWNSSSMEYKGDCSSDYKVYLWYPTLYIVCSNHDSRGTSEALKSNAKLISSLEDLQS